MLVVQIAKGVKTDARSMPREANRNQKATFVEGNYITGPANVGWASARQDLGIVSESSPSVDQRGTLRMARHKRYDSWKTVRFQDQILQILSAMALEMRIAA